MDVVNLQSLIGSAGEVLKTAMVAACAIGVGHSLACFLRMPSEKASHKRRSSSRSSAQVLPAAGRQTTTA